MSQLSIFFLLPCFFLAATDTRRRCESRVAVVLRVVTSSFCLSRQPLAHNLLLIFRVLSGNLFHFLTHLASIWTMSSVTCIRCIGLKAFSSTNCWISLRSAASICGHNDGSRLSSSRLLVSLVAFEDLCSSQVSQCFVVALVGKVEEISIALPLLLTVVATGSGESSWLPLSCSQIHISSRP